MFVDVSQTGILKSDFSVVFKFLYLDLCADEGILTYFWPIVIL